MLKINVFAKMLTTTDEKLCVAVSVIGIALNTANNQIFDELS